MALEVDERWQANAFHLRCFEDSLQFMSNSKNPWVDMRKSTVAVIDYGMGNLHSVAKALETRRGLKTLRYCDSDPAVMMPLIVFCFPGVGAIRDCIGENLHNAGTVPSTS